MTSLTTDSIDLRLLTDGIVEGLYPCIVCHVGMVVLKDHVRHVSPDESFEPGIVDKRIAVGLNAVNGIVAVDLLLADGVFQVTM